MDYTQTVEWLFGLQKFGIKLGLSKITKLLAHLDNPHRRLRCIHIAGSNGKGSTGVFLQTILRRCGYRAGLYTSPHLVDFIERIRINDRLIPRSSVVRLTREIRSLCDRAALDKITFFEFVTALAFAWFAREGADPVIVETGMGGRFDATNVVTPLIAMITNVSLEHQLYLGTTLPAIAAEKAGIIKNRVPVICGVQQSCLRYYVDRVCKENKSRLYLLGRDIRVRKSGGGTFAYRGIQWKMKGLGCSLAGEHQFRNAAMALAAAELLADNGYVLSAAGAAAALGSTRWPGRFEVVQKSPDIVLDGAHNPDAWRRLRTTLGEVYAGRRVFLLMGIMGDKDIAKIVELLTPGAYSVIFCKPKMQRAATRDQLLKHFQFSPRDKRFWVEDSSVAVRKAIAMMHADDVLLVTGSLFVVGEVREALLGAKPASSGRIPM